jgi:hypothetical protein
MTVFTQVILATARSPAHPRSPRIPLGSGGSQILRRSSALRMNAAGPHPTHPGPAVCMTAGITGPTGILVPARATQTSSSAQLSRRGAARYLRMHYQFSAGAILVTGVLLGTRTSQGHFPASGLSRLRQWRHPVQSPPGLLSQDIEPHVSVLVSFTFADRPALDLRCSRISLATTCSSWPTQARISSRCPATPGNPAAQG